MPDFDVVCAECGETLTAEFRMKRRSNSYTDDAVCSVTPCPICLESENGKGYDQGKEEAMP